MFLPCVGHSGLPIERYEDYSQLWFNFGFFFIHFCSWESNGRASH